MVTGLGQGGGVPPELVASAFDQHPVTGIVVRIAQPGTEAEFEAILKQITRASKRRTGYLGSEVFPPVPGVQNAYVVLYRYDTAEHLRGWLQSPERQALLQEIAPFLAQPAVEHFLSHQHRPVGTASAVIAYRIKPEELESFSRWRKEMQETARTFEGYLGTEYYEGLHEDQPEHISVLRFASRSELDAWIQSSERAAMLEKAKPLVEDSAFHLRRVNTGFEAWFDTEAPGGGSEPPSRWRQALMVLSVLGPLLILQKMYFFPLVKDWPPSVAIYVGLAINLMLMSWVLMPYLSPAMGFWLRPCQTASWKTEAAGLGIIFAAITLMLFLCWWFPFL